ncbi:MAG: geranylgeranyl reductase family protein [Gammaproteobacteria bacterium]|nr:geranylgeranyl reductase family protein [Gammaproteobacteria bacterium]NIR85504.1 geranylgeranyl reductase family protein [Gammaproteobacteria bacterium]NIU06641.1 geranylgeranyl reductase family protein [Gammaproteobacteria bacterium]NIX87914.1 geranylgeranyl reductase family protein [Gammaproteobacteria bacterium]
MSATHEYDVLVVGLGPGGASAALTAAEGGLTVLGIERSHTVGEPIQCAEFIPSPMGAYARDGVRVQPITGMKSTLPSGRVEASAFPGIMIDRARFDRSIARRAADAGAILETDRLLAGLDADRRVALIRFKSGEERRVGYRLLVAADGPHSPVAAALRLRPLRVVQTRQYTVPLRAPYTDTDIWLSDEFPGGYGWLFPKGEVANVGVGADKRFERDLKAPLERLHRALAGHGLVGAEILLRTGGAIPVEGLRERLVERDSVLFVGDAAGLTHPVTGAGIAAAVVSGERAGRAAVAAVRDRDPEALADFEEDVRDQYEVGLQRAVERRAWLDRRWRTPAAGDDGVMRRGWIAFDEYFAA